MIETAKQAAKIAGEFLLQHYGKVPQEAIRKKAASDFLSFVDEKSEEIIVNVIREKYPEHAILAEEGGAEDTSSAYRWIIDPLDGTTNYLAQVPVFSVSIALQKDDELLLGVIYEPLRDELFWAEKGKGAFLNDAQIHVSNKTQLKDSLIATGFPFKSKQFLGTYLSAFEEIFDNCMGMRRLGSAAVDLAYVAAGRFDGFWEIGLNPWDVAAGAVLIQEAGGQVSDFWLGPNFMTSNYLLSANKDIQKQLSTIVTRHFKSFKPIYTS